MVYENLLLERGDAYAVVTLNRPKVMNALNRALFAELDDAFTASPATQRYARLF